MSVMRGYAGVARGAVVVLNEGFTLPEGTPVMVLPQVPLDDQWLTLSSAAGLFALAPEQLARWVRFGKVRASVGEPTLVNAGDVEDAIEQNELFTTTMASAGDDE